MAGDVLKDPLIRGRRATTVAIGLTTVDRTDEMQVTKSRPLERDTPDSVGNQLNLNAHLSQLWHQHAELGISYQRLAPNQRDVKGPLLFHKAQRSLYET